MRPYTLCFDDESHARTVAAAMGRLDAEGHLIGAGQDVQVIGTATISGTQDADGNELTPARTLSGFYVNVLFPGPLPAALTPYQRPYGSGGRVYCSWPDPDPGAWPYGSGS